jgi:hypothetical protein
MGKWSNEEIQLLKEFFPNGEEEYICKILNRKWKTISEYARKMDIHREYRRSHTHWTKENIQFLINNFYTMDYELLVKKIGTTKETIKTVAYSLGLKRYDFKWTENKYEILKKYYSNSSQELICQLLENNCWQSICHHAEKIGLRRETKYQWNKDKDKILEIYYYDSPWEKLFDLLSNNNKSSIQNRARKLGLKRKSNYSEKEERYLRDNYLVLNDEELSKYLDRSISSVKSKLSKMHLKRSNIDWENTSKEVLLNMLMELSEKLGRTPGGRELTQHGLPSPITYTRYFGTYANACDLIGIRTDSLYGNRCFSKNGDVCLSNCEAIVTDYLISNKIFYKKDEYYFKYIDTKSRKKVDWVLSDGTFVEYFGLPNKSYYKKKMEEKREICKNNNIKLIEIFSDNLRNLDIIFSSYKNI